MRLTDKEIEEYKALVKFESDERAKYKKEEAIRVINARTEMNEIVKNFQVYLLENKSKLVGKKLFLVGGGRTYFFDEFFNEFVEKFGLTFENHNGLQWLYIEKKSDYTSLSISICVNGGYYSDNEHKISTAYCKYVRNTFADLITIDSNNKFVDVDTEPRLNKVYNYEAYEAAKLAIRNLEKEIELINDKISDWKKDIPSELR